MTFSLYSKLQSSRIFFQQLSYDSIFLRKGQVSQITFPARPGSPRLVILPMVGLGPQAKPAADQSATGH